MGRFLTGHAFTRQDLPIVHMLPGSKHPYTLECWQGLLTFASAFTPKDIFHSDTSGYSAGWEERVAALKKCFASLSLSLSLSLFPRKCTRSTNRGNLLMSKCLNLTLDSTFSLASNFAGSREFGSGGVSYSS